MRTSVSPLVPLSDFTLIFVYYFLDLRLGGWAQWSGGVAGDFSGGGVALGGDFVGCCFMNTATAAAPMSFSNSMLMPMPRDFFVWGCCLMRATQTPPCTHQEMLSAQSLLRLKASQKSPVFLSSMRHFAKRKRKVARPKKGHNYEKAWTYAKYIRHKDPNVSGLCARIVRACAHTQHTQPHTTTKHTHTHAHTCTHMHTHAHTRTHTRTTIQVATRQV